MDKKNKQLVILLIVVTYIAGIISGHLITVIWIIK